MFTKMKLIRYCYFINIYIIYRDRAFMLMKFVFFIFSVIKLYNVLSIFIYDFKFFLIIFLIYNFQFLHLNQLFKVNFIAFIAKVNLKFQNWFFKISWYLTSIYSPSKDFSESLVFKIIVSYNYNYNKVFFLIL